MFIPLTSNYSLGISCEKTYQIDVHSDRWLYRCVWGPQGRARSVRDWLGSGGGGHGAGEGNALEEKGEEAESTERPSEAMQIQQSLGQPSVCQGSLRGAEEPRSWHRTALRPRLGLPGKAWCGSSPAGPAAGGHQLIASCVARGQFLLEGYLWGTPVWLPRRSVHGSVIKVTQLERVFFFL